MVRIDMKKLEKKEKINIIEKLAFKVQTKKLKNYEKKMKKQGKKDEEIKQKLQQAIIGTTDLFEVTNKEGKEMTKEEILKMSYEETIETLNNLVEQLEKLK